ncbi:Pleiotropic drug resistance protein ABC Superfamily, partial [Phytophthora palmivora]
MVNLMIFILFGGFVVSKNTIPDWLIWLYWIDPVAWTVRSAVVSQYRSSELDVCVYKSVDYCAIYRMTMGQYALSLFDVPSETSWVGYGIIFMAGAYIFFMMLSYFALEYHRYERPEYIALPHEEKVAVSTEDRGAPYSLLKSPRTETPESGEITLHVNTTQPERKVDPVAIAFKDLWYTVRAPAGPGQPVQSLDLLKSVTGYALPGKITALMGSTGAGKTTLMDVIAGRKTEGTIKGTILLNGFEASNLSNDIHSTGSTFREAITFSAFLRQGDDVPDSRKFDSVDECLEMLGLDEIADQIIRGSSMEKLKRLTIGVEMAAQPSVLFLDEPTSGLDARSAKVIMDGVRKVADSGRTVLCTIHQPSTDVFHMFDSLLMLKRGGEMVYFGDLGHECKALINYFEAIPGVQRITDGYNPATWMMEVIGAGVASQHQVGQSNEERQGTDFVKYFNTSANKELLDAKMAEAGLFQPSEQLKPVSFSKKRAASNNTQLRFLLDRFFTLYWRTPSYNLTRLFISVFLGLVFGLVYVSAEFKTYQGVNSGLGMVFISTVFIGMVSFISILPLAFEERAAFYRERASQTYNTLWYFISFTIVELP